MEDIIFECSCGKVKGAKLDKFYLFRGIPYAKTERCELPELIKKFDDDIFDATQEEIDGYQSSSFYKEDPNFFYAKEFRSNRTFKYAESPMTLNIITSDNNKKKPVLIFFHGGGFETGTVGELPYGTCIEYAKREVVFVSVGYRLNVFGLYGGVNYGLADMVASVDWVIKNIEGFGGDPNKITIIGQSAGAMSIMDLICSKSLEGKISGAIMMSGGGKIPDIGKPALKKENEKFWNKVLENTGSDDVKKVEPKVLYDAWVKARKDDAINTIKRMQPCVDGVNPPDEQRHIVKQGKVLDIPIMIGVTSQDVGGPVLYGTALELGLILSKQGHKPVYGYYFDRTPPGNSYKAFHAVDLWYMFGNLDKSWRPFEKVDYDLLANMADNVANFVKEGKPSDSNWEPVSKNQKGFRHFDGIDQGLIYPNKCRRLSWKYMLFDRGPM